jgi:hypothetical protein
MDLFGSGPHHRKRSQMGWLKRADARTRTGDREEYRQALDWLNEQTGERTHFFGIELQVGNRTPSRRRGD